MFRSDLSKRFRVREQISTAHQNDLDEHERRLDKIFERLIALEMKVNKGTGKSVQKTI